MQNTEKTITALETENAALRTRIRELETAERNYRQTKKALKEQQVRLLALLNKLPAFVYLQAPDHTIRFANRYFRTHFGNPDGRKCHEILRGQPSPCPECQTFQVFETQTFQQWQWDCPLDGRSYEVLDYPFMDVDGTLLVLELGIDITSRKEAERDLLSLQAELEKRVAEQTARLTETVALLRDEIIQRRKTEDALRTSEQRYALAVAGANDGIWDRDLVSGTMYFSSRWKSMLGYSDHEISDDMQEWKSRIHDDDYETTLASLEHYLNGRIPSYEVEFRMLAKDGTWRWIRSKGACHRDSRGNAVRIAGSHSDITLHRQMEEALSTSEKKYRKIFQESQDMIFIFDTDDRLVDANRAAVDLIGHGKEELLDMDFATGICANPADMERFLRALFADGYVKGSEVGFRRKGGEIRTVHLSASLLRDEVDVVTGYMGIARDISDNKQLEQQLFQAQKMESLGLLAGGVAHDFNNLLTAICGYGETIREQCPTGDTLIGASAEQLLHAAERARELTHNLLAVSRKQVTNPRPILINDAISDMKRLLERIIGEDIELTLNLSMKELTVMADQGQLEQVLINLAANARDAMPAGGCITIETDDVLMKEDDRLLHGLQHQGRYVRINVADSGAGMNEQVRQKAFEPFFTTKEVGKGTGLGLSITYGIIRQHDGAITVESAPGKGTQFSICLPSTISRPAVKKPREAAHPVTGTETILIAEDEDIVKTFLQRVLLRAGYNVITAADGDEAIARFREYSASISLVISDVVMPKKNGSEIYEDIRGMRHDVKFIFMSGYTADVILSKGLFDSGAIFITKPFTKNDILLKIRDTLDGPGM